MVSFLHGVRERHQHRIDVDPSYPVALATGSTAAVGVLAASPAIAAAVGVLVTQLLGVNDRHHTRTRPTSTWGTAFVVGGGPGVRTAVGPQRLGRGVADSIAATTRRPAPPGPSASRRWPSSCPAALRLRGFALLKEKTMSYAATLPRPDTVSITVSGPSTALAYARALAAKAQGWAGTAILYVKMAIRALTRIPRIVGNIALSALSTKVGYDAVVTVVGKAARLVGRARVHGHPGGRQAPLKAGVGFLTGLVRHVAPKAADTADRPSTDDRERRDGHDDHRVDPHLRQPGRSASSSAARWSCVSTIRAAGIASAALVVHALTKGAAAARIVQLVPRAMTAVVWLTNPWKLLLGVAAVMAAATAYSRHTVSDARRRRPARLRIPVASVRRASF